MSGLHHRLLWADMPSDGPLFVAREIHRDGPPINGLERFLQHRHLRRRWPIARPTVAEHERS